MSGVVSAGVGFNQSVDEDEGCHQAIANWQLLVWYFHFHYCCRSCSCSSILVDIIIYIIHNRAMHSVG